MVDVAQLVEPRIVIPAVAGSSPVVHPTFGWVRVEQCLLEKVFGPLAQLVEQLTLNQLVVGSIPTRPTIQLRSKTCKDVHSPQQRRSRWKYPEFLSKNRLPVSTYPPTSRAVLIVPKPMWWSD